MDDGGDSDGQQWTTLSDGTQRTHPNNKLRGVATNYPPKKPRNKKCHPGGETRRGPDDLPTRGGQSSVSVAGITMMQAAYAQVNETDDGGGADHADYECCDRIVGIRNNGL